MMMMMTVYIVQGFNLNMHEIGVIFRFNIEIVS